VDRAELVEVISAASTILRVESRFDLDLALHVCASQEACWRSKESCEGV
jgi:hypothetical protein